MCWSSAAKFGEWTTVLFVQQNDRQWTGTAVRRLRGSMRQTLAPEEVPELLQPPRRLYERLAQIPGFTWDRSIQPFHSVRTHEARQFRMSADRFVRLTIIGTCLVYSISDMMELLLRLEPEPTRLEGLHIQVKEGRLLGDVIPITLTMMSVHPQRTKGSLSTKL